MENDDTEVAKERLDYTGDGLIFSMSENLSCTFQKKPRQKRGFFALDYPNRITVVPTHLSMRTWSYYHL